MKGTLAIVAWLISLYAVAQPVSAFSVPNWLILTEVDTRRMTCLSQQAEFAALAEVGSAAAAACVERRIIDIGPEYFYAGLTLPLSNGGLGLLISHNGVEAFKQSRIGFAYGKKVSSILSIGAQFNYNRISFSGYGSAGTITAAINMRFRLGEATIFSCIADNPVGGKLGKTGEKIASRFAVTIGHTVSEKVTLLFRVMREQGSVSDFNLLVNYAIHPRVSLDCGFTLNRSTGFIGSAISFKNIKLRQVVSWSQTLGVGPALILEYKKAEEND